MDEIKKEWIIATSEPKIEIEHKESPNQNYRYTIVRISTPFDRLQEVLTKATEFKTLGELTWKISQQQEVR